MAFFTSMDGVRLHYEVEGVGPPLVLHLGAGCDTQLWREAGYVGPLSKRFTCILFDHRGHGPSDHPVTAEANHIDRYADDVVTLIEHLGQSRALYFGWSNAVSVGMRVAQLHPDLFDRMVLLGGIARPTTAEQISRATADRLDAIREKGWRSILDDMEAAEKFPVPTWFLDRVMATDLAPWIAWIQARPDWHWSLWDAAPAVQTPTLLIAGELEDPGDVVGELAGAMPDASRVHIPDREHINAFLYSEYIAPLVIDFLAMRTASAKR